MKLNEFHITDGRASPVCHRNAVASGNRRICSMQIDLASTSSTENCFAGEECFHAFSLRIVGVSTPTMNRRELRNRNAEMMLCDQIDCEVMLVDGNIWMLVD